MKKFQNKQLWCECQLVALWNAYRFLGGDPPVIGTKEYQTIVKDSGGIYGGCITIEEERKRLGITFVPGEYKLKWIRENLPVHLGLFTRHRGHHSVLVVKVYRNKLLLANYARGKLCWITWKKILKISKSMRVKPYSYRMKGLVDALKRRTGTITFKRIKRR